MRRPKSWYQFITTEGAKPAIVEAITDASGICKGHQYQAFDVCGNFIAIWNNCDNAVWCHKGNLKVIYKGTVI